MQGIVDQNCEAMIRLVVGNADSQRQVVDAVIDTGFTGFLTLPVRCWQPLTYERTDVRREYWGMEALVFLMCTVAWSIGTENFDN